MPSNNKEYIKAYGAKRRKLYPDLNKKYCQDFRDKHPTEAAEQSRKYRVKCKFETIKHYSNGTMQCACCGEKNYEFLGIDHINGGGAKMRRELGHGNISRWLRSHNFPLGYRVLCHNCNMSIGFYGYCPHQKSANLKQKYLGEK